MTQEKQKMLEDEMFQEVVSPEFLDWGNDEVAFIKYDLYNGSPMWSIYHADGTKIAVTDSREFAFVMAKQNDLQPQSVH